MLQRKSVIPGDLSSGRKYWSVVDSRTFRHRTTSPWFAWDSGARDRFWAFFASNWTYPHQNLGRIFWKSTWDPKTVVHKFGASRILFMDQDEKIASKIVEPWFWSFLANNQGYPQPNLPRIWLETTATGRSVVHKLRCKNDRFSLILLRSA